MGSTLYTHTYICKESDWWLHKRGNVAWGYSWVVEHWPGLYKTLDSISTLGVRGEKERGRNAGTLKRACEDRAMQLQTKTWKKPLLLLDHPYLILGSSLQNHNKMYYCCASCPASPSTSSRDPGQPTQTARSRWVLFCLPFPCLPISGYFEVNSGLHVFSMVTILGCISCRIIFK